MRASVILLLTLLACRDAAEARVRPEVADQADGIVYGSSDQGARHVRTLVGFSDPESVLHDAEQDVYFVSNVAGFGSNKDDNGYIARVPAANLDSISLFVQGGTNGVTLHAPKGMAIQGDTLWVCDIDVVRGFHRVTGQPVGIIDFSAHRPVQLNDIATGPNELRVTDTGIWMVYEGNVHSGPDRIFSVGAGRSVSVVANSPALRLPNGIAWDSAGNRWIVVSFDRFAGEVAAMRAGSESLRHVLRTGRGQLDGVVALRDGAIMFASWADSSIHILRGARDERIIREVPEPADIGYDVQRSRVLIPLTVAGQVQIWDLPR